jgi:hypothetical protein
MLTHCVSEVVQKPLAYAGLDEIQIPVLLSTAVFVHKAVVEVQHGALQAQAAIAALHPVTSVTLTMVDHRV